MQRRDLLKTVATTAGLTILKSGTLRGQNAPSNKLNVALVVYTFMTTLVEVKFGCIVM